MMIRKRQGERDEPTEDASQSEGSECGRALKQIRQVVLAGLKHGFFDYSLHCEVQKNGKRRLVFKAGVSHQFYIAPDEIERTLSQ
jgi:hypothetical protein